MDDARRIPIDELEAALDTVAEWLIAAYGPRLASVYLTLEGYYTADPVYWGIVPMLERGAGESRETLPSGEVRDRAEAVIAVLCPDARLTRESMRDVRDVARSRRVSPADVSGHRRLDLLGRFGRPAGRS